jgi:hypothetical protein
MLVSGVPDKILSSARNRYRNSTAIAITIPNPRSRVCFAFVNRKS